jgi:hypothetical protein
MPTASASRTLRYDTSLPGEVDDRTVGAAPNFQAPDLLTLASLIVS